MLTKDELLSSVISIVPFPIEEMKPGLYPGNFEIKSSIDNIPEILHVGESVYHVEVDAGRSITVTVPSHRIAESIVNDFLSSQLAVRSGEINECGPGIFWKFGKYSMERILLECAGELESARQRQHKWFTRLVEMADDDWEKLRQHRAITDMQRKAAKFLSLERPWLVAPITPINAVALVSQDCPACGSIIRQGIILCPSKM